MLCIINIRKKRQEMKLQETSDRINIYIIYLIKEIPTTVVENKNYLLSIVSLLLKLTCKY